VSFSLYQSGPPYNYSLFTWDTAGFDELGTPNQHIQNAPIVIVPANVVGQTATTAALNVGAVDTRGEANLTYTWSAVAGSAPVSFDPNGTHDAQNTTATFTQAGNYTLQVTATDPAGLTATSQVTVVVNQTADHFVISVPASAASGAAFDMTVTVVDQFGNTVTDYTGTLHFSTTDPDLGVILPPDYTFGADDHGSHVFTLGVTLITPGDETITAMDTASGLSGNGVVHIS
jgi:hypothetical protein